MPEFSLHLGAHKTATTYVQATLSSFRAEIALAGTLYMPRIETEAMLSGPLNRYFRLATTWRNRLFEGPRLQKSVADYLRNLPGANRKVLISDENLIGVTGECLAGQLYPNAGRRLQLIARFLPAPVRHIHFSVRDYGPFLSSIVIESLRWGVTVRPEAMIADFDPGQRHWSALLDIILAAFPEAQLHLWRYEDFPQIRTQVLSALSGLPEDHIGRAPNDIVRPSFSAAAVAATLQSFETVRGPINRRFATLVAEARNPRQAGEAPFNPWPENLKQAFSATYAQEWLDWQANPRITLLHPQPAPLAQPE